ncbi:MAG: nitroreductase family protein [Candidatus Aenigmarchaeota archaeon]|nr:nitroreductase family protein [Candidatus Aenigmarchaeota archaeon]MDW8149274.1 nitroreductase family protein [Candidatus Aenigmarchaeota archaeon]
MEFFKVIKNRHSIRAFKQKQVEEKKIIKILETINSAPSAGNLQAYEVFLVKNEEKKKEIARAAYNQDFIAEAPIVLVFCANPERSARKYGERGRRLYSLQDATIAAAYSQLAATALGLSSCWVGAFDEEYLLEVLEINKSLIPVAIIPVGYANEEPITTSRRNIEDLVKEI